MSSSPTVCYDSLPMNLAFSKVGSFHLRLPLIPHIRAPSVSSCKLSCTNAFCILHCYGSHCFSVLRVCPYSLPCFDEVLQLSVHPYHRQPFGPTPLSSPTSTFPTSVYRTDFTTSPHIIVAYPHWGFTARSSTTWVLAVHLWWKMVDRRWGPVTSLTSAGTLTLNCVLT